MANKIFKNKESEEVEQVEQVQEEEQQEVRLVPFELAILEELKNIRIEIQELRTDVLREE
jgi:hypothetical protein